MSYIVQKATIWKAGDGKETRIIQMAYLIATQPVLSYTQLSTSHKEKEEEQSPF